MSQKRTGGNLVVFDIETGGFSPDKNPLVEVCFICYDTITFEEVGRYESLIKPYYNHPLTGEPLEYTEGAMNTHGISIEQMNDQGKELGVVMKEIVSHLKAWKTPGMHGKPMLAGHNIHHFDIPYIDTCMSWFKLNWSAEVCGTVFDTLHIARLVWPQTIKDDPTKTIADHKLETCCTAVGVELTDSHRASGDTEANAQMVLKWIDMLRGRGSVITAKDEDSNNKAKPYKF